MTQTPEYCFFNPNCYTIEKLLILNLNMGNLIGTDYTDYVNENIKMYQPLIDKLPPSTGFIILSNRKESRFELLDLQGNT